MPGRFSGVRHQLAAQVTPAQPVSLVPQHTTCPSGVRFAPRLSCPVLCLPSSSRQFPVFFIIPISHTSQAQNRSYRENKKSLHCLCLCGPAATASTVQLHEPTHKPKLYALPVAPYGRFPWQAVGGTRRGPQRVEQVANFSAIPKGHCIPPTKSQRGLPPLQPWIIPINKAKSHRTNAKAILLHCPGWFIIYKDSKGGKYSRDINL